jgi:hypothetical protein
MSGEATAAAARDPLRAAVLRYLTVRGRDRSRLARRADRSREAALDDLLLLTSPISTAVGKASNSATPGIPLAPGEIAGEGRIAADRDGLVRLVLELALR